MAVTALAEGRYLLAAVPADATDSGLSALLVEVSEMVARQRSFGVVIDVSALDIIDSYTCRVLESMSGALRLRGAEVVIVGIQPAVAFALARLGLTLSSVQTALDLDGGLELLAGPARVRQVH
jgi:rsbT antagonist protein RsbS